VRPLAVTVFGHAYEIEVGETHDAHLSLSGGGIRPRLTVANSS
jgi:hypothetical protein